jgi:hypothetical protein
MTARMSVCSFLLLALVAWPQPAGARVNVDIGINLGVPPVLVPVPSSPVQYAPQGPPNYFSYGGQYFVFQGNTWYVSAAFNGPWVTVSPAYVS